MKRTVLLTLIIGLITVSSFAQEGKNTFKGYLYNDEYEVYLRINFYDQNIKIPGQELYGDIPGYLGRKNHSFCWVMVSAEVESEQKATMAMVNDFGSEDLTASLTYISDSTYVFRQEEGSTVKIPKNGKWQKLPKKLTFKRK